MLAGDLELDHQKASTGKVYWNRAANYMVIG